MKFNKSIFIVIATLGFMTTPAFAEGTTTGAVTTDKCPGHQVGSATTAPDKTVAIVNPGADKGDSKADTTEHPL